MFITSSVFLNKEIFVILCIINHGQPEFLSLVSVLFQSLVLSNNKIKRWPHTVISSLTSLSSLKLDNNSLAEVIGLSFIFLQWNISIT
jgi:Leucine-rich repeat (LRR) protein